MNVLNKEKQIRVIAALADGCSIRATERITGVNRETVGKLGLQIGEACANLHESMMVGVQCHSLELDELWAFIAKKQANRKRDDDPEMGNSYTFLGLDSTSKAIISYAVGRRDAETTETFCMDLRRRIVNRPAITSDGYRPYVNAVDAAFGCDCDYAQVIKTFSGVPGDLPAERRYSPAKFVGVDKKVIMGNPDMDKATTSHVERVNLSVRTSVRRFTRLSTGFSKKYRHHSAAVSLFIAVYNFCTIHSATRLTPAMAIGIADHPWTIEELIDKAMDARPAPPAPTVPTEPEKPVLSRAQVAGAVLGGRRGLRVIKGGRKD